MSAAVTLEEDWDVFRQELASILRLPVDQLVEPAVVGVDFDIDSLGLSELAAFVFERYGVDFLDAGAAPIGGVSLGELHRRLLGA